jgi:hypothetical protein
MPLAPESEATSLYVTVGKHVNEPAQVLAFSPSRLTDSNPDTVGGGYPSGAMSRPRISRNCLLRTIVSRAAPTL